MLLRAAIRRVSPRLRRAWTASVPASSLVQETQSICLSYGHAPRRSVGGLTALVRTSDGIANLAEAFAILRGIEREFGRLVSYRFVRDYETQSEYQRMVWVTFQFPASIKLVRASPGYIYIPAPIVDSQRPGGIGLDELEESLLLPTDIRIGSGSSSKSWQSSLSEAEQKSASYIKIKIELGDEPSIEGRSSPSLKPEDNAPRRSAERRKAIAYSFLHWRGFSPFDPLKPDLYREFLRDIQLNFLMSRSTVDQPHRRLALRTASRVTTLPDPNQASDPAMKRSRTQGFAPLTRKSTTASDETVVKGETASGEVVRSETVSPAGTKSPESEPTTKAPITEGPSKPRTPGLNRKEMMLLAATMGKNLARNQQVSGRDSSLKTAAKGKSSPRPGTSMLEKLKTMLGGWW